MFRFVAIVAFIVALILFVVVAIGSNVSLRYFDWGFVSTLAGLLALALEGAPISWPTRQVK